MKCFIPSIALMGGMVAFFGCSRAVTGGYVDSPDGKYRCWMRCFGPWNYSVSDRYTYRVRVVEVLDRSNWVEKPLFVKAFQSRNPYVEIDPTWDKENDLKIVLYDYGRGVSRETALKAGAQSNVIEVVSLMMDKTGAYRARK